MSSPTAATTEVEVFEAEALAQPPAPQVTRHGARAMLSGVILVAVLSLVGIFLPISRELIGLSAVVLMLCLIFLKLPIAIALFLPAVLGMYALQGPRLVVGTLGTLPYGTTASWTLSVVPMFVFMGLLLWRSGVTSSLFDAAKAWLSWLPAGLAVSTNFAGTGLAAVSGSTVGSTYALARMSLPEMLKAGYNKRVAIGSVMAAGLPGQLIPPSILLVVYAGVAAVPVGPQLLAGVGPGVLISLLVALLLVVVGLFLKPAATSAETTTFRGAARWRALVRAWPVPVLVLIIVGGMFTGRFTATEAGAVAALFALGVTIFTLRGRARFSAIGKAALGAVSTTGSIFFILMGTEALSRMLSITGLTTVFVEWVDDLNLQAWQFIVVMIVVYLILGMAMESLPMMLLTVPILIPTLNSLDIPLIWFGVFVVLMGELAVLSPPVGILSFVIYTVLQDPAVNGGKRYTLGDVFSASLWVLPPALLLCVLMIVFPQIVTFIPGLTAP